MTIETAGHVPAEHPQTLDEALAALQGRLPRIAKTETAEVIHKDGGKHDYSYAGLAAVTHAVMPVMSELGLSFTAAPTLLWSDEHPEVPPRFVLAYKLRHTSGESIPGHYPLPSGVSSQATGSAITYARRYALLSVTGLAPEDDDDAAAADAELRRQAREPQAPRQGGGRLRSAPEQQNKPGKPDNSERDRQAQQAQVLADLAVKLTGTPGKTVGDLHAQVYKPAQSRRMLLAEVVDPVTGEPSKLTSVISAAKARMESAAEEAARS